MDPSTTPSSPVDAVAPDADEALNLKQVARFLDVHYMTAYRYVRHGRLPARREGPIWLVERADAEAFLAGTAASAGAGSVDWAARLAPALAGGDEVGGWTIVRDALAAGRSFASVHLDVVAGGIALVSLDVSAGRATAAQERVAVATGWRLVARLGGQFPHRGRKRGTLVLACPPGEHHGLPLALVANLVRHGGFRVVELGTDTPAVDVLAAIDAVLTGGGGDTLIGVGLGVTTVARLEAAAEVIDAVRAVHPDLPVLLGGQAVRNREVAELAGAVAWSAGPDLIRAVEDLARSAVRSADATARA